MHRQRLAPIPVLAVLLAGLLPMQPALTAPVDASRLLAQRTSNQQTGVQSLVKQGLDQFQHGIETVDTKMMSEAAQTLQSAISSAQDQDDRETEALAHLSLGGVSNSRLRPKQGKEACQRSLELYQNLADPSGEALSQLCLGSSYIFLGKLDKARDAFQSALTLYQQFKDPYGEAATNLALGGSYLMEIKPQQARTAFQRSLELYQSVDEPAGEAHALLNVGGSYLIQQEFEQAIPFYEQARERFRQLNQPSGEIMTLFFMSMAYGGAKKFLKVIEVSKSVQALLAQENISLEASFENLVVAGATIAMPRLLMDQYERTSNQIQPAGTKFLQKADGNKDRKKSRYYVRSCCQQ